MRGQPYFAPTGAHVLVDGQYGSTGKGALAAYLALEAQMQLMPFSVSVYSGGPNSGHTFYDQAGEKHVLKQLPTFGVASYLSGRPVPVYLTAGAIIDPAILKAEAEKYLGLNIFVHPNAAVIGDEDREAEKQGSIAAVAGTRSGTGEALARKIRRDEWAIWRKWNPDMPENVRMMVSMDNTLINLARQYRIFIEVSQGFSLGINSQFYPKVTSRECTVMQAIADARIPPRLVRRTYMAVRTYPIRVGNVDGFSSGDWYPDQQETDWDTLGQVAERTTVTNRIRRVATFSDQQFHDAVLANDPDFVFVNFMNYIREEDRDEFKRRIRSHAEAAPRRFGILYGYGPTVGDVIRED